MDTPPAPQYTRICFAIFEFYLMDHFKNSLFLLHQCIDDILALWVPHDPTCNHQEFLEFKTKINDWYGLEWTVTELAQSVDFMDLKINIVNNRVTTTLFEKEDEPILLVPVMLRIQERKHPPCFQQGHPSLSIGTLPTSPQVTPPCSDDHSIPWRQMYLHIRYHPQNLPSSLYQQAWHETIGSPNNGQRLSSYSNNNGLQINFDHMVVAHLRPPNLGNKHPYRNLEVQISPPA
eukprot:13944488-Ditylum_brightwellii.AAC.1